MKRIFLVEDDKELAKNLIRLLESENFIVMHAVTQKEAIKLLDKNKFDLALVDILLPDGSGFIIFTAIKQKQDVPIIFLTAVDDESSVVTGLNLGADDYIIKPFRPRELIARMHTALRKYSHASSTFQIYDLEIDTTHGITRKSGKEVNLSALEYRLLLIFIHNPKSIITRDRLLDEIWDAAGEFVTDNTLTVYIKRLREKIENDPKNPKIILTVRGIGYRLGGADNASE